MWRAVLACDDVTCVGSHYRFQLEDVAYHEKLFSGKRTAHVSAEYSQDFVYEIDGVGSYHRHFIYDYKLEAFEEFYQCVGIAHAFAQNACGEVRVVGHCGLEWQAKKRV